MKFLCGRDYLAWYRTNMNPADWLNFPWFPNGFPKVFLVAIIRTKNLINMEEIVLWLLMPSYDILKGTMCILINEVLFLLAAIRTIYTMHEKLKNIWLLDLYWYKLVTRTQFFSFKVDQMLLKGCKRLNIACIFVSLLSILGQKCVGNSCIVCMCIHRSLMLVFS